MPAVAKTAALEKDPTWSFDGTSVAYVSDGRVFLKNMQDVFAFGLSQAHSIRPILVHGCRHRA